MVDDIEELDQVSLTVILEEYDEICTFVRASEITQKLANMKNYISVVSKPYVDTVAYLSKPYVQEAEVMAKDAAIESEKIAGEVAVACQPQSIQVGPHEFLSIPF